MQRLREETSRLPQRSRLTPPDQGAFLALLVRLLNAKRILEVGTTGYSSLAMAMALPEGGSFTACDISAVELRALNAKISGDSCVESCLLTVADGMMLARKRRFTLLPLINVCGKTGQCAFCYSCLISCHDGAE